MRNLVAPYNKRTFVVATRYVDDSLGVRCGGIQNYALAMAKNFATENLRYEVEDVRITSSSPERVEADVTYSSFDVVTNEQVDRHATNGLSFVRGRRNDIPWVLKDAFPLGVPAYCR